MLPIAYSTNYSLQFDDIAKKTGRNPLEVMPTLKQTDLGTRFIDQTPALNWVTEENQLDVLRRLPSIRLSTRIGSMPAGSKACGRTGAEAGYPRKSSRAGSSRSATRSMAAG